MTLLQALLALAAWTVVSLAAAYYAISRLGAVQAVLALLLRRALRRVAVLDDSSSGGGGFAKAGAPRVRHTSRGE